MMVFDVAPDELLYTIANGGECQCLSFGTSAVQSLAILAGVIELSPTVDCFVRAGVDPVALSNGSDHFLMGGTTQAFRFDSGHKLSVIAVAGSGMLYVSPVR